MAWTWYTSKGRIIVLLYCLIVFFSYNDNHNNTTIQLNNI